MAHVLAKLIGPPLEMVRQKLQEDAAQHAEQGMYLEHLWRNADDPREILFLFRVNDLKQCQQRMNQVHAEARQKNPNAPLPELILLDDASSQ